ncbi:MAG: AAA family ATPase [Spirochaetes bacterium]|nr:AAA family ATPase [Spirochaetota bacterium]
MNTSGIIGHTRQLNVLGLLLKSGNIPNTMLFSGKSGIGKKLVAKHFLASLFCRGDNPPCGKCSACVQIEGQTFPDLIEVHPDGKGKIRIGDTDRNEAGTARWLVDRLSKKSVYGTCGVLIDDAETMTTEAQNALLKTIEEPQAGAHIIIITANKSLILPTILSRGMELYFNPLGIDEVRQALSAAGAGAADPDLLSELSGGSVETALLLSRENTLPAVADICGEIAAYLTRGANLRLDIAAIQKKISMDQILSLLLTIFRAMLSADITGAPLHPFIEGIRVRDDEKLVKIIKILLALRKGLANNLNIRNALKGMLYSIDSIGGFGLPKLDGTE